MKKQSGFTIVELLVVIVVIGVLAAITLVTYGGVSSKADVASMQSDLSSANTKLKMYYAEIGTYPTSNVCPTPGSDQICLNSSPGTTYLYSSTAPYSTFSLVATRNNRKYYIDENTTPSLYQPASGGVVSDSGGIRTHTFTSNGTLSIIIPVNIDIAIYGSGGGGGGGTCGTPAADSGTGGGTTTLTYNSVNYIAYGGGGGEGASNYTDGFYGSNGGTSGNSGWLTGLADNGGASGPGTEASGGVGGPGGKLYKNGVSLTKGQVLTISLSGVGGSGGAGTGVCNGSNSGSAGGSGGNGYVTFKYAY